MDECSRLVGQLLYCDGSLFMNTGDAYVRISDEFQITSKNEHLHLPTNCKNCGAPLHEHICEFCGTEYS